MAQLIGREIGNLVPRVSHLPEEEDERPWERGWEIGAGVY